MALLKLGSHYLKNGLFLAHACQASYRVKPEQYPRYRDLGLGHPRIFVTEDDDLEDVGFVATAGENLVVVIRGSDDISDWKNNIQFGTVRKLGADVHRGFWTGTRGIENAVVDALTEEGYKRKKLWVAGHSRGGALAVLLSQRLYQLFHASDRDLVPKGVFTFGAPRVGKLSLYQQYDLRSRTHLFINMGDPVPAIPPVGAEYYHVKRQHLLLEGRVRGVDIDEFDLSIAHHRFPDFSDHSLAEGYLPNLEANVG